MLGSKIIWILQISEGNYIRQFLWWLSVTRLIIYFRKPGLPNLIFLLIFHNKKTTTWHVFDGFFYCGTLTWGTSGSVRKKIGVNSFLPNFILSIESNKLCKKWYLIKQRYHTFSKWEVLDLLDPFFCSLALFEAINEKSCTFLVM